MPHHGLVFLGWTAACCALNSIDEDSSKSDSVPFDYTDFLSSVLHCGAFSYLKSMLQTSPLHNDEVSLLFSFPTRNIYILLR